MTIFDRAAQRVLKNMSSQDNCIPFGFPRFEEYLPGIMQKTYYLLTSQSGVGKTQITDAMFLYAPYDFIRNNPETDIRIKFIYNSLEMDSESKWIQGAVRYLYIKYNIRLDVNQIQSIGKKRCSQEVYDKFIEAKEYMDGLQEHMIVFRDEPCNPFGILLDIERYARDNGKVVNKEFDHKNPDGTIEKRKMFDHYVPNNPNEYVIIITDHLSELTPEVEKGEHENKRKLSLKETIEKHSDNMKNIRNKYGYTIVDVQQQAAQSEDQEFTIKGNLISSKLEASLANLAESKLTQRKANIVLGLFAPDRYELKEHAGYSIERLGDSYRSLKILKYRNGVSNIRTGLYFDGATCYFKEMPRAKDMTETIYKNIEKLRQ